MSRNYVMQTDSHTLTIIAGIFTAFVLTVGIASFGGEVANYLVTSAEQVHEKQSESQLNIKSITQTASAQNNCPGYGKNFGGGNTCYRSGSTTYTVVLASSTTPGGANAQCNVSPTSTTVGSSVTFDGSGSTASSSITSYGWSFGDGDTATTKTATISHTYNNGGSYTPTLTVTDNNGASDSVDCSTINVNSAPNARNDPADTSVVVNSTVNFDGSKSSDGDEGGSSISSYSWSSPSPQPQFASTNGQQTNVTFPSVGTYDIKLTVTDDEGVTDSDTATIDVNPPSFDLSVDTGRIWLVSDAPIQSTTAQIELSNLSGLNPEDFTESNFAISAERIPNDTIQKNYEVINGTGTLTVHVEGAKLNSGKYTMTVTANAPEGSATATATINVRVRDIKES